MALKAAYEIRCSCGTAFTGDVFEYVLAEHDPELKEAILSGEFNRVFCPSCGHGLPVESRYLYRDEKNRLCVWVCGKEDEPKREELATEWIEKSGGVEFHFLDGEDPGRKFLVFGREGLIELLLKEDPELKKGEAASLRRNPAVRIVMENGGGAGFLLLSGRKIRVAVPLRLPAGRIVRAGGPEAREKWLRHYSRGVNLHNPYSSFLDRRMRSKWEKIRAEEPLGKSLNEFEDFAESWAYGKVDARGFGARYPGRSGFFDALSKVNITRKVRSLRVGRKR